MARIPYPDPAGQSAEVKDRLARIGSLNVTRMMSHSENLMMTYSKLGTALLLKGKLDPVLREAVILRIGQLCHSDYEWHQHVSVARAVGMDEVTLQAIAEGKLHDLTPKIALALRVAEELHRENGASAATMAEATEVFCAVELVELFMVAGYYMMTAGFLNSLGIEIEDTPPLGASMAAGRPGDLAP